MDESAKNHTKVYEKVKSKPENENTEKAETEKMKSAESAQINPKLNEYQCTQPSNEDVDGSKRHVKQLEETLEKVNLENTSLKNLEKDLKAKTLQLENDVRMSSDENKLLQEKITKNVETLLERTEDFFSEKRAKENAVRAALKCAQQEQNFQKVVLQKENEISSLKELNRQEIRRQEIIFHWRILLSAVIRRKRVKMSNAIFLERLSEIQAEKNNLAEELSTKVAEINELNETIEKLEGMKKTLETECLEKSFLVSHKEGQVQIAHEWAQRMGQEYTENQIRQSQLERELSATLKELKTNQEHYSHLMGAYTSREIELVKLQTEVERQVQQNALAQENLKKAERITEEIKTKNIQLKEEINKGMIEREREYERKEDIKKKEQANRRCLKEITSLRSQFERLKTENQRLRNKSHQLEDELFGRIRESTHSSPDSISYLDEGLYRHSFFNADDSAGDDPSF